MSDPSDIPADYDVEAIQVLRGFDVVRKRPGMYIGNTDDGSGLHNMVCNVVEHAILEVLIEETPEVVVQLNPDGSCTVRDNSRGLRTDNHEGVSAAEAILTSLRDRKFSKAPHWMYGNFESTGVAIVNALATWLKLTVWRDGEEHFIEFRGGETVAPLREIGEAQTSAATRSASCPRRSSSQKPSLISPHWSRRCACSPRNIWGSKSSCPNCATQSRNARKSVTTVRAFSPYFRASTPLKIAFESTY